MTGKIHLPDWVVELFCEFSICFSPLGQFSQSALEEMALRQIGFRKNVKKSLGVAEFDGFYRRCQSSSKSVAKAISGVSEPGATFKMAKSPSLGML